MISSLTYFKLIFSYPDIGYGWLTIFIPLCNLYIKLYATFLLVSYPSSIHMTIDRHDFDSDSIQTHILKIKLTLNSAVIIITMPLSKEVFSIFVKRTYKFGDLVQVGLNMFCHIISLRLIFYTVFNFFNHSF